MKYFTYTHECYDIIDEWYDEGRTFKARGTKEFSIINYKGIYTCATQLVSRLFGKHSSFHMEIILVQIIYQITKNRNFFNLVSILSNSLQDAIRKDNIGAFVKPPKFYTLVHLGQILTAHSTQFLLYIIRRTTNNGPPQTSFHITSLFRSHRYHCYNNVIDIRILTSYFVGIHYIFSLGTTSPCIIRPTSKMVAIATVKVSTPMWLLWERNSRASYD